MSEELLGERNSVAARTSIRAGRRVADAAAELRTERDAIGWKEGIGTGLRLRGVGMTLTLDTGGRVREHLEARRRDPAAAPDALAVRAPVDPVQRGGDLPDRTAVRGRRLIRNRIDGGKSPGLDLLESGQSFLELPLELAPHAGIGRGPLGLDCHGVLLTQKKKRRRCDARGVSGSDPIG